MTKNMKAAAMPLRSMPDAWRLLNFLRGQEYDLVHVNNTFSYQLATIIAARAAHLPLVARIRNPVDDNLVNRLAFRMLDCVVPFNRALEAAVKAWASIPTVTCYDGIDLRSPDRKAVLELRRSLRPDGSILIGSAGRLTEQKGFTFFVDAAQRVLQGGIDAHFAVAGDGPLRASLQATIDARGLTNRFRLIGFQEDISSFFAALDIFVCPSLWEGGPYTVLEALLLGKPVVTTAVGFVPELLRPHLDAEVVPCADASALSAAVLRVLGNIQHYSRAAYTETIRFAADPRASALAFEDGIAKLIAARRPTTGEPAELGTEKRAARSARAGS
jgi:glycosyltransferase involved in cell wall biosynthesis